MKKITQKIFIYSLINFFCFHIYSAELTKNDCLPAVNIYKEVSGSDAHVWACLKAGFRKIAWDLNLNITQPDLDLAHVGILKYHILTTFNVIPTGMELLEKTIWYKKDPETYKVALLFQKYLLQKELYSYIEMASGHLPLPDNPYVMGSFLNYGLENIEYYYKYDKYIPNIVRKIENKDERQKKTIELRETVPSELAAQVNQWALENETSWKPQLENDKKTYDSFMVANARFSIQDLEKQNQSLDRAIIVLHTNAQHPDIKKLVSSSSAPTPSLMTTPQSTIKQPTSWWKKSTAYLAALAAAGVAAYAYFTHPKSISKVPTR